MTTELPPRRVSLVFLGTGSAFTLTNWQSNMVLEVHEQPSRQTEPRRLLIDCGGDARHSLNQLGLTPHSIDGVYISHAHADHIGGLEWLALVRYFAKGRPRPAMYVNRELAKLVWQAVRPGLDTLQNVKVSIDTYFDVCRLPESGAFTFGGLRMETLRSIHFMANRDLSPSYGLRFTAPDGQVVLMPTDTQYAPAQLIDFYRNADVIFQDCEITPFKSGVHAHFQELTALPDEVRAKMWLYHYQDGERPDAQSAGFAGWVEKGQRFEFVATPVPA